MGGCLLPVLVVEVESMCGSNTQARGLKGMGSDSKSLLAAYKKLIGARLVEWDRVGVGSNGVGIGM